MKFMKKAILLFVVVFGLCLPLPSITMKAQSEETDTAYTYRPAPRINRSGTISCFGYGWGALTGDNNWLGETLRVEYIGATNGINKVNIKVLDQNGNLCGSIKKNVSKGDYVSFPLMIWEGTWTILAQSVDGISGDIYVYMKSFI